SRDDSCLVLETHKEPPVVSARDGYQSAPTPERLGIPDAADIPPSHTQMAPVMNDESSDARNSARFASSSGRPMRPSGIAANTPCATSSVMSLLMSSSG